MIGVVVGLVTGVVMGVVRRVGRGLDRSGWTGLEAVAWATFLAGFFCAVATAGAESDPEVPADVLRVPSASTGPDAGSPSDLPRSPREPDLGSLLELPSGFGSVEAEPAVAGAGETEWRRRFRRGRETLSEAQTRLTATKRELDSLAGEGGGQWNVAPAIGGGGGGGGGQGRDTPLSFKLRQQLKREREAVEQAEKEMRRLQIEADLAGVPKSWRGNGDSSVSAGPREVSLPY